MNEEFASLIDDMMHERPEFMDSGNNIETESCNPDNFMLFESLFNAIAQDSYSEVYENGYSGRGMMGEKCWAIVGSNGIRIIEVAAQHGVTGAQMDNMGFDWVVYWPCIHYTNPTE